MSYFVPYIDETGYHYPTYNEILEDLVEKTQAIFGSGIYLGNDSKDYQMLAVVAEKAFDCYQTGEIVYNAHSAVTAIGTGLDYIVALNGLKRKSATRSVATLSLIGTAWTVITNGKVSDSKGNLWDLPRTVTLDGNGQATVDAICEMTGEIEALENTINNIATPTAGWISVTNNAATVTGSAVETDSELRGRQGESTATPSQSTVSGLKGAILSVDEVGRAEVYENYTDEVDDNGIPAHSVCCVVEGGDDEDIADTIRLRKGLGCGIYGSETVVVEDEHGHDCSIKFSRVTYVDVDITINITRKAGYAASTATEIKTAIAEYLAEFAIGMDLTTSIIWMVAQQVNTDYRVPTFSITSVLAAKHGQTQSASDVEINFDEVARGNVANITVNVT